MLALPHPVTTLTLPPARKQRPARPPQAPFRGCLSPSLIACTCSPLRSQMNRVEYPSRHRPIHHQSYLNSFFAMPARSLPLSGAPRMLEAPQPHRSCIAIDNRLFMEPHPPKDSPDHLLPHSPPGLCQLLMRCFFSHTDPVYAPAPPTIVVKPSAVFVPTHTCCGSRSRTPAHR